MSQKKEIRNILKAEMIMAARQLIKGADSMDFDDIYNEFKKLYEKIAAYRFLDSTDEWNFAQTLPREKQSDTPVNNEKPVFKPVGQVNTHLDAAEKTEGSSVSEQQMKSEIKDKAEFFKKVSETTFHKRTSFKRTNVPIQLGVADKIALIQNLFDNNTKMFEQFILDVNNAKTYDEALTYVKMMKNIFDWDGKDEYEFRLLQLIQARFA